MTATAAAQAQADPMLPRPFRVIGSRLDTDDTVTLSLEPLDGDPLEFEAGQFTMLHAFGVGEVPISISGDPTWPGPLVHTIRDVGNVTHALVTARWVPLSACGGPTAPAGGWVTPAAEMWCWPPVGSVWRPCVPRCGRSPTDAMTSDGWCCCTALGRRPTSCYAQDLERWAGECGMHVEITVDYGPPTWDGRVGPVTKLLSRAGFDPPRTTALLCGPEIMMTLSVNALLGRGVPADRLRLSMERNMKCGVGLCGHCQLREFFICVDGPVLDYERLAPLLDVWEL